MTNHPNRSRSYWYIEPRGFANEYSVGVATNAASAADYEARGYTKITRDRALREMTYRGDDATDAYVGVSVDHSDGVMYDRFEVARAIRDGKAITGYSY